MSRDRRVALWGAAIALLLPLGIGGSALVGVSDGTALGPEAPVVVDPAVFPVTDVDSLAARARAEAPFRSDGRPSRVSYDPARSEAPRANEGLPPPALVLTGLMGGNRPLAMIEGIPGRDGPVVLATGDTIAGLKVQRIKEGRVTVTGMDTMWVLTIRGAP